jgi:hypothetical protein
MRVPRGAITDVVVARRIMAHVQQEVLEALAVALRRRVGYSMRPRFICWAERSGRLEYARCWAYLSPAAWEVIEAYDQQSPLHLRARPRDAALHTLNRAERRA